MPSAKRPPMPTLTGPAAVVASTTPGTRLEGARRLPLALIDPNPLQPRQVFDTQADAELAASITQDGVIEPVLVRPHPEQPDRYLLIAGERRVRAARAAGMTDIPVIIREGLSDTEAYLLTVQENLQRANLELEDEARQFKTLLELTGLSQRELAKRLGKDHNYINRRLRLLEERPDLLERIRAGEITQLEAIQQLHQGAPPPTLSPVSHDETGPDPESEGVERVVLDALSQDETTSAASGSARIADSARRGRSAAPWRRRPLDHFVTWIASTPPEIVPAEERASVRAQVEQVEQWLVRWKAALAGEDTGESEPIKES